MIKGILMGVTSVALALTLALGPSLKASATTWGFGGVWGVNTTWHLCLDDSGNIATSGNPIIFAGNGNNQCGGLSTENNTPLAGTQFAVIDESNGFELELKNQSNGAMCVDDRGSVSNGTQYVIKSCNASIAQSFWMCVDPGSGQAEMFQLNGDFVWLNGDNTSNGTPIVVHNGFATNREEAYWAPSPAPSESDWVGNC